MKSQAQLIVFGEDWGGLPSSTQHIIKQLRQSYEVTWVNSLGLRSPKLSWHDLKRVFAKAGRLGKQLLPRKSLSSTANVQQQHQVIEPEGFNVVEPQYLPFPGNSIARRINRVLLHRLLKRNAKPLTGTNQHKPVIWISLPNAVDALHYLQNTDLAGATVIYYCCDDFSALAGVDHQAITRLETELASQANVIVATSPDLVSKFPEPKTHWIPHGVDTQLFKQNCPRAIDLPVGKPIAGFYGSIVDWIDIKLLAELSRLLPDWNFVMIGAIKVDVSELDARPNVHFLGEKAHHQLPGYSQHWQVSLLPFVLNEQIMACNPLKLREYMATGKPIVSVDFPEARRYQPYISLANTATEFAAAIKASKQESPTLAQERQLKVADESWQSVAERISQLISDPTTLS